MEIKSLDDTPHWIVYAIFVVSAAAFLFFIVSFIVQRLGAIYYPKAPYRTSGSTILVLFMVVCGGVVTWFLFASMFVHFHAVYITPDRIELVYFWPRSRLSIETSALRSADVIRYRSGGGHLEIATDQHVFSSVDFRRFTIANEIHAEVEAKILK